MVYSATAVGLTYTLKTTLIALFRFVTLRSSGLSHTVPSLSLFHGFIFLGLHGVRESGS